MDRVAAWKQDDDSPKFGKRARRWFTLALRAHLDGVAKTTARKLDAETLDALVRWYAARPRAYAVFTPFETCRGRGYSIGEWGLDVKAIAANLLAGLVEVDNRRASAVVTEVRSLDDWLRRDLANDLGQSAIGGSALLPSSLEWTLRIDALGRRERWPRTCASCGQPWTPRRLRGGGVKGHDRGAKRCPDCRAQDRTPKRESTRGAGQ